MTLSREASRGSPTRLNLLLPRLGHPAQYVVLGFAIAVAVGTLLLLLPLSRRGPGSAGLVDALFTATSAVCVTGLVTVDTPVYWSGFGQAVILALIQVGGFGIMALATLLGLLVSRKVGLRNKLNAQTSARSCSVSRAPARCSRRPARSS